MADRYNRGAAWTLDHKQHNKKESYEVPVNERKAKGGLFMSPQKANANRGAAWTLDHNQHNKKESYEVPVNKRKRY